MIVGLDTVEAFLGTTISPINPNPTTAICMISPQKNSMCQFTAISLLFLVFSGKAGEGQQQTKQRNGWDGVNKIDGSQHWQGKSVLLCDEYAQCQS